jgi:hypothetical protein
MKFELLARTHLNVPRMERLLSTLPSQCEALAPVGITSLGQIDRDQLLGTVTYVVELG